MKAPCYTWSVSRSQKCFSTNGPLNLSEAIITAYIRELCVLDLKHGIFRGIKAIRYCGAYTMGTTPLKNHICGIKQWAVGKKHNITLGSFGAGFPLAFSLVVLHKNTSLDIVLYPMAIGSCYFSRIFPYIGRTKFS